MKDYFGRPVPENLHITFSRGLLAECLWEYGEKALAERALALSNEALYEVQVIAVWHHDNDPEPEQGPRLSNARVMARAAIEFLEGRPRDTARRRRRTRPEAKRFQAVSGEGMAAEDSHWAPEVRLRHPNRRRVGLKRR